MKWRLFHCHSGNEFSEGVLYVSPHQHLAIHLCPCGCGEETLTQLTKGKWTLSIRAGEATLTPSVHRANNWCKSHYWITKGKVIWC